MYALRNKVQLIGNLGNEPEVRVTEKGRKWVRFSMATHAIYRDAQGSKKKDTQWHNLVAWGKLAELAEKYLQKGKEIAVEGKLVNRSYMDKEGIKRYVTEIAVTDVLLLGSASSSLIGVGKVPD